jgi:hypothetical protein
MIQYIEELRAELHVKSLRDSRDVGVLGENDLALDWLEKAYADHSIAIVFLKVDPQMDTLRASPRFHELQRKLRLPD